jgi:hypothetical protein
MPDMPFNDGRKVDHVKWHVCPIAEAWQFVLGSYMNPQHKLLSSTHSLLLASGAVELVELVRSSRVMQLHGYLAGACSLRAVHPAYKAALGPAPYERCHERSYRVESS